MVNVIRLIFTVVFGFLWWWVYNRAGAALEYLAILGSVLAVCVCCCRGGEPQREWNFEHYMACIRRCWLVTVVLMVGLFILAIIVVWVETNAAPSQAAWLNILIVAIGAPLFVRAICCAYDSWRETIRRSRPRGGRL